MNRLLVSVLATVGLVSFGHAANAQSAFQSMTSVRQLTVSYADLAIDVESGAQVLMQRLKSAARTVCGPEPEVRELTRWQLYRICTRSALDSAVAAVGSEKLTAIHQGKANPHP